MRYLAIAPLAIAAAISFSGAAMADEYVTQQNKESYEVSAESTALAQEHTSLHAAAPLGYASSSHGAAVNAIFAAPQGQNMPAQTDTQRNLGGS